MNTIIPELITELDTENNFLLTAYKDALQSAQEAYDFLKLVIFRELISNRKEDDECSEEDYEKLAESIASTVLPEILKDNKN